MGQGPDSEDFRGLGHACLAEGRFQDACAVFEEAVEAAQTKEDLADAYLGWGLALSRLERYVEAIGKYEKAIQIEEDYAEAYLNWGNNLIRLKRYGEAIEKYQKAIQIKEDLAEAYVGWGNVLSRLKRYDEATEKYGQAVQIKENYAEAYYNWGLALDRLKRYEEAIENYEKAIQIKEDFADAYLVWGNALSGLERYEEAIEKYGQAIQIEENYAEAYHNWGLALDHLKRFEEAIERYEKAIQIKEDYAGAYLNLSNALDRLKRCEEAIEKYEKAVQIKEDDAEAHVGWGFALDSLRRYEEAIEKYQKAIQIKEDYAEAYLGWGVALASLKRYEEAIEKCEKTRQVDAYNPYPVHVMANLYTVRGMYREAWERWESALYVYRRAHKKKTDLCGTAEFFRNYGNVLRGAFERLDEAEHVYNEGLKFDQNHVGILAGLVQLHLARADKDAAQTSRHYWDAREACQKAEQELTRRLKKHEDSDTRFQLGQLCLLSGRYDDAEIHLLKALDQKREEAEIYSSLGVVRNHKGDFQEAARYFEQAWLRDPDDLTTWSNLAEAYLRENLKDKAEAAYKAILRTAPGTVEAHIGLGEVYLAMGGDDEYVYDQAIRCFDAALEMADSTGGSKRLKRKDRAAVLYSRACARVMFYEKSPMTMTDERPLQQSLEDFKECRRLDRDNYKAERAKEKLTKRLSRPVMRWFTDKVAPAAVFGLAAVVFILSQLNFFFRNQWNFYGGGADKLIEGAGSYALLTFGSLLFMVVALYLPQILKLKVGGIELEKKPFEDIKTPVSLGITWEKKPLETGIRAFISPDAPRYNFSD